MAARTRFAAGRPSLSREEQIERVVVGSLIIFAGGLSRSGGGALRVCLGFA